MQTAVVASGNADANCCSSCRLLACVPGALLSWLASAITCLSHMQVPRRFCAACNDLSFSSSTHAMLRLLLNALGTFLFGAHTSGAINPHEDRPNQLTFNVGRQLQQGGFLQLLPAIATIAEQDLRQLLPAPAVISHQLQLPVYRTADRTATDFMGDSLQDVHMRAELWRIVLSTLKPFFSAKDYEASIAAVLHSCAMQLSTALMYNISCCMEHMPAEFTSPPVLIQRLLGWASEVGLDAAQEWEDVFHRQVLNPAAAVGCWPQLLQPQHCAPCISLSLLVLSCAALLQDETESWSVLSRNADAWRLACSSWDQLPAAHNELLAQVGCSSKLAIYTAATLGKDIWQRNSGLIQLSMMYSSLLQAAGAAVTAGSGLTEQQWQSLYCAAFLVPTIMVHLGAHYPTNRAYYLDTCWWAVRCAKDGWGWLFQQLGGRGIAAAATTAAVQPAGDAPAGQHGHSAASGQQQFAQGFAEWLAALQPDALTDPVSSAAQLLTGLLRQLPASSSSSSGSIAGNGSCGNGSSSSGGSDTADATAAAQHAQACTWQACEAFELAALSLQSLDAVTSQAAAAQGAAIVSGLPLCTHMCNVWQEHCAELWDALEGYVRWCARRPAAEQRNGAPLLAQVLLGTGQPCLLPSHVPSVLLNALGAGGIGGNEQLWSLAVSSVKSVVHATGDSHKGWLQLRVALYAIVHAVLLQDQHSQDTTNSIRHCGSSADASYSSSGSRDSSSRTGQASTDLAVPVQAVVPWLVMCAHWLRLWLGELSMQLHVQEDTSLRADVCNLGEEALQQLICGAPNEGAAAQQDEQLPQADQRLAKLMHFLQDSRVSAQLSAAGYSLAAPLAALRDALSLGWLLEVFPSRLRAAAAAASAGSQEERENMEQARAKVLQDAGLRLQRGIFVLRLEDAAARLADLPFSWGCNNPSCCNTSGPSELQLVKGKAHLCSGCRTARYCSRECQTAHWKRHRPACNALAAAALAGSRV